MKKFTILSILILFLVVPFFVSGKFTESSRLNKSEIVTLANDSIVLMTGYWPKHVTKVGTEDRGGYIEEIYSTIKNFKFEKYGIVTVFEKREIRGMPNKTELLISYEPPPSISGIDKRSPEKFLIPEYIFSDMKKEYEDAMKRVEKYEEAKKNRGLIKEFREKFWDFVR